MIDASGTPSGRDPRRPAGKAGPGSAPADQVEAVRMAHLARFEAIVHHSSDVAMFFDAGFVIRWVSPAIREVFGLDEHELVGRDGLDLIHPDDRPAVVQAFLDGLRGPGDHVEVEFRIVDGRGRVRWVEEVVTDLSTDPAVGYVVGNLRDVTARVDAHAAQLLAASRDGLTGLANRAQLLTALAQDDQGDGCRALVSFDVVHLGDVNNALGAAAGEQLLVQIARRIEGALPAGCTFARIGNDQFAVLRPGTAGLADAIDIVRIIRGALADPIPVDRVDVLVAVCFGVAREPGASDDQLIRRADMALYRAKQKGPDKVVVFEPGLERSSQDRVSYSAALKRALERGDVVPHYQPVVDLDTGRVVAVEALARWDDPTLGPVPPDVFIPVAEATGLICDLGARVLLHACRDAAGWLRGGRPLQVAVNVSALQLTDAGFTELVLACLASSGLPPSRLTLEITETAALWDLDVAMDTLLTLERRGVRLSVDDFGTGFSSLALLARLPIGAIKIDRTFVAGLAVDERMEKIVAGTVALGTAIGFPTVAEGIEHPAQAAALRRMGCDFGQGFLWSPAVPAAALLDVIHRIEGSSRTVVTALDDVRLVSAGGPASATVVALEAVDRLPSAQVRRRGRTG